MEVGVLNIGIDKILPEIFLSFVVFLLIIFSIFKKRLSRNFFFGIGILGALLSIVLLLFYEPLREFRIFYDIEVFDSITFYFRFILYTLLLLILIVSIESKEIFDYLVPEYIMLLYGITLASVFLAGAKDLLMIYLSIEFMSLLSYLLTGFIPKDRRAHEGALKYVFFGAVSSATMIFGMSFIYGITGSLKIDEIASYIARGNFQNRELLLFAFTLLLVGFGYKVSAFPFHSWCPDAYEAAPTPVTAFFSVGPKAGGLALFIRFFDVYMRNVSFVREDVFWLIALLSAFTMTFGNLVALKQNNIKRLLAYSSIAHAGYMLMGIVVFSNLGVEAILFYVLAYLLMNIGAFIIVIVIVNNWNTESIDDYKGLAWKGGYSAFLAVLLSIFLFSLTGIPPLAGFIGKWYLFAGVIEKQIYWLAIIGVINSVISLYYYARIVKRMILDYEDIDSKVITNKNSYSIAIATLLALFTIVFGIFFSPVFDYLRAITSSIGLG